MATSALSPAKPVTSEVVHDVGMTYLSPFPIAHCYWQGATDSNYSTASTGVSYLDNTNVRMNVVVPDNGRFLVRISCTIARNTTYQWTRVYPYAGNWNTTNAYPFWQAHKQQASAPTNGLSRISVSAIAQNQTPGTNWTCYIAWHCETTANTSYCYHGPNYGPVVMEAFSIA